MRKGEQGVRMRQSSEGVKANTHITERQTGSVEPFTLRENSSICELTRDDPVDALQTGDAEGLESFVLGTSAVVGARRNSVVKSARCGAGFSGPVHWQCARVWGEPRAHEAAQGDAQEAGQEKQPVYCSCAQ